MTSQHAHQVKDWNGDSGERWVRHQEWLDQMLHAFGTAAIEAAQVAGGDRILDIGCGAGTTSFALAERAGPGGHVTGVDISEPLIRSAKAQNQRSGEHVDFMLADAGQAELPADYFDLLYSRFGVMFFENPAAAFRHMRRALKSGGRLAFICWRGVEENDWVRLPMGAIKDLLPPAAPLPAGAPGPFSFGDPAWVKSMLDEAGYTDVSLTPVDHDIVFGRGDTLESAVEDALHMAFEIGPLSRALADQSDETRALASDAVRKAFAERATSRGVIIKGAAWTVIARNRPED